MTTQANMMMKAKEWEDFVMYRIGCDCMDSDHDMEVWASSVGGFHSINLSYKMRSRMQRKFFESEILGWLNDLLHRVVMAAEILLTGHVETHGEFVLGKENISGLRTALDEIEDKFK
jgi:hypothetical protein